MRSGIFRPIAAILIVLMLTAGPVSAGPVAITEVIQVIGSYQNPPDLRLRSLTQTPGTPISGVKGSTVNSDINQSGGRGTAAPSGDGSVSLLSGLSVNSPQRGVEIIDQGDVDGTICDCGEILIPAGGFTKWPLLFLAAIPLFFIDGDDVVPSTLTPTPALTPTTFSNPTPTPTPQTPIPEPASLLLFGSGLIVFGAGLRRRMARAKLSGQAGATKEAL